MSVFAADPPPRRTYHSSVSPLAALLAGLLLGGLVAAFGMRVIARTRSDSRPDAAVRPGTGSGDPLLPRRLLGLMDPGVVVVGVDDAVVLANPAARTLGIVRGSRLTVPELLSVAH